MLCMHAGRKMTHGLQVKNEIFSSSSTSNNFNNAKILRVLYDGSLGVNPGQPPSQTKSYLPGLGLNNLPTFLSRGGQDGAD